MSGGACLNFSSNIGLRTAVRKVKSSLGCGINQWMWSSENQSSRKEGVRIKIRLKIDLSKVRLGG